jgi:hypothetical protein
MFLAIRMRARSIRRPTSWIAAAIISSESSDAAGQAFRSSPVEAGEGDRFFAESSHSSSGRVECSSRSPEAHDLVIRTGMWPEAKAQVAILQLIGEADSSFKSHGRE